MDYSLLIMKINWDKHNFDEKIEISEVYQRFSSNLNIIESTKEHGIYYHIAIIDYLQEFNL